MKITGNIIFNYKDKNDAELVYNTLKIDNEDYVESELSDEKITCKITSEKLGSFLATSDDLIASEIVCEKIIKNTKQ